MKAIDDRISKYKMIDAKTSNEKILIHSIIQDLETLKEQLNTNVITDNSKVNENLLEENRQLKEQHKEDVIEAFNRGKKEGLCNLISLKFKLGRRELEAEQYYQSTHEKK